MISIVLPFICSFTFYMFIIDQENFFTLFSEFIIHKTEYIIATSSTKIFIQKLSIFYTILITSLAFLVRLIFYDYLISKNDFFTKFQIFNISLLIFLPFIIKKFESLDKKSILFNYFCFAIIIVSVNFQHLIFPFLMSFIQIIIVKLFSKKAACILLFYFCFSFNIYITNSFIFYGISFLHLYTYFYVLNFFLCIYDTSDLIMEKASYFTSM